MPSSLPPLPADHPLTPYAEYMMHSVDTIYHMMWLWLGMKMMLLGVVGYFIYVVHRLTRRVEDSERFAKQERETTAQLLSVIKGWTVIGDAKEVKRHTEVQEATKEIKVVVAKIPEETAAKVSQVIEEKHGSFSGDSLPIPKLPPLPERKP